MKTVPINVGGVTTNLSPSRIKRALAALSLSTLAFAISPYVHAETAGTQPVVKTQEHVDSPHAVWDETAKNFVLMSGRQRIEETINWVSHGKQDGGLGAYGWRVPDDPRLKFLGVEPNHLLYFGGPATGDPKETIPIWAGFGADAGLPTDKFRAEAFNMEIVDFSGPGRMELFKYNKEMDFPVTRLWSSHDSGLRPTWVKAGTHTHNETTFTRPGRYEVTYRATARTTDGTFIHSEPQTLVWQVGGTNPELRTVTDIEAAYRAAPTGGGSPTFSMAPSTADTKGAKDGILTTLRFSTGNANDSGKVLFFVNGFYLAEVGVEKGVASWDEMIGDTESQFQAVYLPDDEAASGKWISAPLTHSNAAKAQSTAKAADALPEPAPEPIDDFQLAPFSPTSLDVEVSAGEITDYGNSPITVAPADDSTTLQVTGGFYYFGDEPATELPENVPAECEVNFTSAPGHRTTHHYVEDCAAPGYHLMLKLVPEARSDAPGYGLANIALTQAFTSIPPTTVRLNHGKPAPTTSPTTSPTTTPSSAEPTSSAQQAPREQLDLHSGHVDIAPRYENGALTLRLKDETNLYERGAVWRAPRDAFFSVPKQVARPLREDIEGFAQAGDTVAILPETQRNGVVWPGLSNEDAWDEHKRNYHYTFRTVDAPEGGKWIAFAGGKAAPDERIAGSDTQRTFTTDGKTHMHLAWAFTRPGTYKIGVRLAEVSGQEADEEVLTFKVEQRPTQEQTSTTATTVSTTATPPAPPSTTATTATTRASTTPTSSRRESSRREIHKGHIDFGPANVDGNIGFYVNEDEGPRDPDTVALRVFDDRKTNAPQALAEQLGSIVAPGDTIYHLPLTQQDNTVWPGWDTMKVAGQYPNGLDIEVRPKRTPSGAHWWAGHIANLGTEPKTLASSDGTHTVTGDGPFHVHADWVFTRPGRYDIEMRAVEHNGTAATGWETVTFLVGNDARLAPGVAPSTRASSTTSRTSSTTTRSTTTRSTTSRSTTSRSASRPSTRASSTTSRSTSTSSTSSTSSRTGTAQAGAGGQSGGSAGASTSNASNERRSGGLAETGASPGLAVGLALVCLALGTGFVWRNRNTSKL